MDSPNSKTDEKWVEDRLASLAPPAGWRPNTDRALESLQQRSSSTSRTMRFSMAGITVVAIAAVVMLLPWHLLWTPKTNEPAVAAQQTTPPPQSDPAPQPAPAERGSTPNGLKDPVSQEPTQTTVPTKTPDNPLTGPPQEPRRPKKNRPIIATDVEQPSVPQTAAVTIQGQDSGTIGGYQAQLAELKKQLAELSLTMTPENVKVMKVQAQIKELEGKIQLQGGRPRVQNTQDSYQARLAELKKQLAELSITHKPQHPDMMRVQAQIKELEARLQVEQNKDPQPAQPSNVTEPVLLSQVQPEYTPEAREARIQGTVEILIIVRADGTVKADKVVKPLDPGLDASALAAVEKWRFRPATKDGKPVNVMVSVLLNFSLR